MLFALGLAGCEGSPPARFVLNKFWILKQENAQSLYWGGGDEGKDERKDADQRTKQLVDTLYALFGSPDAPYVPESSTAPISEVLDARLIGIAAGPVQTDSRGLTKSGLYRQHCAHCHGVTGDGMGPTALFLNPYPRDYRSGRFKFKSTAGADRPTDDDLRKTLVDGVPGTAMPSFKVLSSDEIDALVQYVKYLAIRGETERELIYTGVETNEIKSDAASLIDGPDSVVGKIATMWASAAPVEIPAKPDWNETQTTEALARGKQIFYTTGACFSCHGESQLGDGQLTNYDAWSEEVVKGESEAAIASYLAAGAQPPRHIRPRNLRAGIYRGGRRPIDLFWRVRNGINGSGMPNKPETDLPPDDVWALIEYVRSLPYEPLSNPFDHDPTFQRPRN